MDVKWDPLTGQRQQQQQSDLRQYDTQQNTAPAWAQQLFATMQQQSQAQTERIAILEQQLADQAQRQAEITTPPITLASESIQAEVATKRRKDLLPIPPEFDGKRSEFRPWLAQIEAKLRVDKSQDSEDIQFWYLHSRLRGKALQQVTPWVTTAQATGIATVQGLYSQLRIAYDDQESADRAARKLNVIRQGTKPFKSFLAEFERTMLDAGGLDWSDQVKKTFLSNSISIEIQKALVATPTPARYIEYCALLHTTSSNLEALRGHAYKPRASDPIVDVASEAMDWEVSPILAATATAKRATWVNAEVRSQRKERRVCLRCGRPGHFIRGCDLLPAAQPTRPAGTTVAAIPPSGAVSDTEPGKE